MGRDLLPSLKVLIQGACASHTTFALVLADGSNLYLATVPVITQGQKYIASLVKVGAVKQSLTRAADRVTATTQNVDMKLGGKVADGRRLFDRAQAVIGRVYARREDADEQGATARWLYICLFVGVVTKATVDEQKVEFEIVSDISAAGIVAAARTFGGACHWVYKGLECGATSSAPTCDKRYDSDGGCKGRQNQHRFGGFHFNYPLTPVPPDPNDGSDRDPPGRRRDPGDDSHRFLTL